MSTFEDRFDDLFNALSKTKYFTKYGKTPEDQDPLILGIMDGDLGSVKATMDEYMSFKPANSGEEYTEETKEMLKEIVEILDAHKDVIDQVEGNVEDEEDEEDEEEIEG